MGEAVEMLTSRNILQSALNSGRIGSVSPEGDAGVPNRICDNLSSRDILQKLTVVNLDAIRGYVFK